jgi:hypothetical protein
MGCKFCSPPEPPVEQVELLQEVVEVLEAPPEPQPEIPLESIAAVEPNTAMAAAFRRSKS